MSPKPVRFRLNGRERALFVEEGQNLLDALRHGLGDTTPKYGCGQGTCGSCTVLVDGEPILSCLMLAEAAEGRAIETLETFEGPELDPLQQAFVDHFAAQCGYCTPGMLMAAEALLRADPAPDREAVEEAISGNICRCTGYEPIVRAVLDAATRRAGRTPPRGGGR